MRFEGCAIVALINKNCKPLRLPLTLPAPVKAIGGAESGLKTTCNFANTSQELALRPWTALQEHQREMFKKINLVASTLSGKMSLEGVAISLWV